MHIYAHFESSTQKSESSFEDSAQGVACALRTPSDFRVEAFKKSVFHVFHENCNYMKNLFISVSNPEESRQVSQKLDSLGYNKHHSFRDTESYIKVYREEKDYSSFDNDDGFWGRDCEHITAAEFLNPAARGLPECFYVNVPTEILAQAVRDKLKSLGHVDCCSGSDAKTGRVFSFKDKSFSIHSKDYIVTHPYKITEEVSLDLLFSQPDPPVETEIPGILTGDYTLFKKENGDFSIRERGVEILTVSAENVARIKEEVKKQGDQAPLETPA